MAAPETQLMLSVGLIEKDVNADTLWVWCYPSVSAELREVLLSKCCLRQDSRGLHTFVFGQFRRTWYYISTVEVQEPTALKKVTHFSIVVTAKDFNPERYAAFSRVLCRMYIKHGSPVKMMEGYIAVLTKGICQSDENGSFLIKDYDVRKAYLAGSVKDVVSQFGMETIILYTALMLKKRIVVHHPQVEVLLEFTRALPALTWHRKDWSILHPYVHLTDSELENLRTCTGYVAGFVDPEVSNRSDLFDVYVNLPDSEITISQSAKEAMSMGKLHKDIGLVIVQSAENADRTDGQIIKDISIKTREILANLASLAEECENSKITLETLKQRHFPPATENFLFHLAAAEQLLKI
ncbi:DENN domain-containing protein 10-like isoform X1 [Salvelinus namaycush]|uniref:DENN domain-containing protein 10-like isoform X1 n=1 Tax=Salvelinus namaycush TaxID=8040 RepID=A0A8U0P195_SALNM|nr:DENN domain-containing protein 10-like isoform X1 [Salvelinus namaycush]